MLNDKTFVIEDPYPDLKELLPVDMVTFAYQIADGMVSLNVATVFLTHFCVKDLKVEVVAEATYIGSSFTIYKTTFTVMNAQ